MAAKNYGLIESVGQLEELVGRLLSDGLPFGFDIETGYDGPPTEGGSLHPEFGFVVGFSFTNSLDWARYVPLRHDIAANIDVEEFARITWPLMVTGLGVAHNAKFELRFLSRLYAEFVPEAGDGYFPVLSDSMIEAYIVAEYQGVGLKALSKACFGHDQADLMSLFPDLAKNKLKSIRFNVLELTPNVVAYACEDAVWCLALHQRHYPKVKDAFLYGVEMAILPILCHMEDYGVLYDWTLMTAASIELEPFMAAQHAEIMADLSAMSGKPVNINLGSPTQVGNMLFGDLGMKTTRYTKASAKTENKKMSTDAVALAGLAKKHPVVKKILRWKEQKTLHSRYLSKYPKDYSYARDGRTHPNHMQTAVGTGRFAVSDPPYQQTPKRYHYELDSGAEYNLQFREIIRSGGEHYLIGYDYGQVELRVMAGEAQEPTLLRAFDNDEDVHSITAALMLGVPLDQVTEDQRDIGKAQPLTARVLTPSGWTTMGALQVGDEVIGSDGQACKVTGVYPQGVRQVYRVTTSDGASTECCGEHLWTVRNKNTKSAKWQTMELRRMVASGLYKSQGKYPQAKYELPPRPVVEFDSAYVPPIDSYVLGLLLGDGCFRHDVPNFSSADRELIDAVRVWHEGRGGEITEVELSPGFWTVYLRDPAWRNFLTAELRLLGLWGKRDSDKSVPDSYMSASPRDRLALLQGLMDTDGNVQASGAQLRITSKTLSFQVQELARSLGGFCSRPKNIGVGKPSRLKNGKTITPKQDIWRTYVRLPSYACPFKLARKRLFWRAPGYVANQCVQRVEEVKPTEVQCISVSSADGLYVTDEYVMTHNTMNFA